MRKPAEDISSECYVFSQRHRARINNNLTVTPYCSPVFSHREEEGDDEDDGGDDGDDSGRGGNEDGSRIVSSDINNQVSILNSDEEVTDRERRIQAAAKHVKEAHSMRIVAKEKVAQAKEDCANGRAWNDTTVTFYCDYAQNMELPYFGNEQPSETYYYSALTINGFGIVDTRDEQDKLHIYIYDEAVGKKGGNNVASLVLKHMEKEGMFDRTRGPAKEFNLIMDNFAEQNKNTSMLLIAPWLVERGYFEMVNFIFLVVGHTKNPCDRLFNLAKCLTASPRYFP